MLKLKIVPKGDREIKQDRENKEDRDETNGDYEDTNDLFEGEIVNIGETPKTQSWKFPPLFKEGLNGEIAVWQIGFEFNTQRLKTVYGKVVTSKGEKGKLVTAYHPIVVNNSGRNLQDQATLEARRKYLDQYETKNYIPKGSTELPEDLRGKAPMLSKKLKLTNEDNDGIPLKKFPVNVSEKIDGIRNLTRLSPNGDILMRSRNNKAHEAPLTHIKEEMSKFLRYLPPGCEVDGELYIPGINFNEISGAIRTKKGIHPKHNQIRYFIFDLIEPQRMPWEDRYALLITALQKYMEDGNEAKTFRVIQTYTANSEKEIMDYHDKFVKDGYEGLMVRRYGCVEVGKCCLIHLKTKEYYNICSKCRKGYELSTYKPNKNNNLLKYKKFQDKEVTIIGAEQGVGTEEGAIVFKVKDEFENVFTVRPMGTIEERRELYKNRDKVIGKPLTIKYQELSKDNVPRFPVAVAIRDYE